MQIRKTTPLFLAVLFLAGGCGALGIDERIEYRVLASVTKFSVPDSSRANDIRVSMAGVLGPTTAFSLAQIVSQRTDTLFEFAVYARQVEKSGVTSERRDITYDTTLVLSLNPPRARLHYFKITGSNGVYLDSSYIY